MICDYISVVLLFYTAFTNAVCGDEKWMGCKQNCESGWKQLEESYNGCCESFWSCFGSVKKCKDEDSCNCNIPTGNGYLQCGTSLVRDKEQCQYIRLTGWKCDTLKHTCTKGVI